VIGFVGGGSWGTALAAHAARSGHTARLWILEEDIVDAVNREHVNPTYLPGVELPHSLAATHDLAACVQGADLVVVAVPSEFCRATYSSLARVIEPRTIVVSATKGLETETLARMSTVAREELPGHAVAVLSGPSFAVEVAREMPTAVVAASDRIVDAEDVQGRLASRTLRIYASDDVTGVELGGALKNVIAIAAGIVEGLGLGHNTQAALITRGLVEISRLAVASGGRPETLAGLAGLGDLVLTCTGGLSRNRRVGQAIAAGHNPAEALAGGRMVAEGIRTTRAACALARAAGVEMPIAEQMSAVLYAGKSPRDAIDELMSRHLKRE